MQILDCLPISCFNHRLATWYAMGFNIAWLECLVFILNIDDSKFLLFIYQAVVIENSFLEWFEAIIIKS